MFGPSLGQVLKVKVKVTRDNKWHFSALLVACVQFMFGKTPLASSLFFMVALCNRADHYIFILFLLLSSSFFLLLFFLA